MFNRKKGHKVFARTYIYYFYWLALRPLGHMLRNNCYSLMRWICKNIVKIISGFAIFLCLIVSIHIIFGGGILAQDGKIEVTTAWISAVITITGLAWTLDHERKEGVENHRLTIRPYLVYGFEGNDDIVEINVDLGNPLVDEDEYFDSNSFSSLSEEFLNRMQEYECLCSYNKIDIHVADYAEGVLGSIIYRGNEYFLRCPILLRKNTSYRLILDRYFFLQKKRNSLPTIDLCIEDMRTNTYYYTIGINEGLDSSVKLGNVTFRLVKYDVIGCDCRLESFYKRISKRNKQEERKKFWDDYIKNLKSLKNMRALIEANEKIKADSGEIHQKGK